MRSSPQPPAPPYDLPLDTVMQAMATIVLWGGTAGLFAFAGLAVTVGSLIEPLYDIGYRLR